jgi:hypothetical protein
MTLPTAVSSAPPHGLLRNEGTVFVFCPLTPEGVGVAPKDHLESFKMLVSSLERN